MSFLIIDNRPVAYLFSPEKAGPAVISFDCTDDGELVNMQKCQVSNAQRWERWAKRNIDTIPHACLMGKHGTYREFYAGE